MLTVSQPRHEHDCDRCVFLGQIAEQDLYFCPPEGSVILRDGPDGDYASFQEDHAMLVVSAGGRSSARLSVAMDMVDDWRRRQT